VPDGEEQLPLGQLRFPNSLRPTYANFVNVNFTPWDFRLTFAVLKTPMPGVEVAEAKEAGAVEPEVVVDVILPANLMDGLIKALQQSVDRYAERYGSREANPDDRNDGGERGA
jgi:hypothetical protein